MAISRNEFFPDQDASIEKLQQKAVSHLKAAASRPDSLREAILSHLEEGYRLGLSPSELTDYFAVSTPNIIEEAGYTGAAGDSLAILFDKLHDEFRRKGDSDTLPDNFITKDQAKALGWDPKKGNLQDVAPGKSIGGDPFQNREGKLPDAPGRVWTEADTNYKGGFRGSDRILYSNDGLIYKTTDHYTTFQPVTNP